MPRSFLDNSRKDLCYRLATARSSKAISTNICGIFAGGEPNIPRPFLPISGMYSFTYYFSLFSLNIFGKACLWCWWYWWGYGPPRVTLLVWFPSVQNGEERTTRALMSFFEESFLWRVRRIEPVCWLTNGKHQPAAFADCHSPNIGILQSMLTRPPAPGSTIFYSFDLIAVLSALISTLSRKFGVWRLCVTSETMRKIPTKTPSELDSRSLRPPMAGKEALSLAWVFKLFCSNRPPTNNCWVWGELLSLFVQDQNKVASTISWSPFIGAYRIIAPI